MGIFSWFLTVVLVLDCIVLILLILIQLPKKEAGIGQAFGGAATDALFGAGSGTALTKITKWAAGVFFGITFLLAIFNANAAKSRMKSFEEQMKKVGTEAPGTAATAKTPPATPLTTATNVAPAASNLLLSTTTTNKPASTTTNVPAESPK